MNKLVSFAIFCLAVGYVAADGEVDPFADEELSQLRLTISEADETSYLTPANMIFSDYCLQARDLTLNFIKTEANSKAAEFFKAFFGAANEIGDEVLKAEGVAVEEAVKQIERQTSGTCELASAETVSQKLTLFGVISQAAKAVINAVIRTISTEFFDRLNELKLQHKNPETIKSFITGTCSAVSYKLQNALEDKLTIYKANIRRESGKNPEIMEVVNKATTGNIGCVTAGSVAKISKVCDVLRMAGPSLYCLLNL